MEVRSMEAAGTASLVVDISPLLENPVGHSSVASVIDALRAASTHYGYAHIVGHGIPRPVTARLLHVAKHFFRSKDPYAPIDESDMLAMQNNPPSYRGYQPIAYNVTDGLPDAHHALDYMRTLPMQSTDRVKYDAHDEHDGKALKVLLQDRPDLAALACGVNVFPDPHFGDAVHDFMNHALRAGVAIMNAIACMLCLPDAALQDAFSDPFWILRLIHYPRDHLENISGNCRSSNEPGKLHMGCGPHRDYGFLTFVLEDSLEHCNSALQVCLPHADWTPAKVPQEGAFMLNFGDCIEAISGGIFPATLHRVLRPSQGDRFSIACFVEPNFTWSIQSLLPSPTAKEFSNQENSEFIGQYVQRLNNMSRFTCYGDYLLSKVSSNFVHATK